MDKRDQFFLEYYKVAWDNINKHREGLWKVLVPYLGFYAIFSYRLDNIELLGILLIILLFVLNTFIMAVSINFNLWFVRNMAIITNIETYFLKEEDYGKLIPEDYKKKPNFKKKPEIWIFVFYFIFIIHVVTYVSLTAYFILRKCWEHYIGFIVISIAFFISLFFIRWWWNNHKKRYDEFLKKAPGYAEASEPGLSNI